MAELGTARTSYATAGVLRELRSWLCSGRAQAASGAFCAWRDTLEDEPGFEYPEITGYALSWLAWSAPLSPEEERAGRRAAQWLAWRLRGGDRSARAAWEGGAVYTFDLGMIASGLMSFGRLVNDESLVEQGRQLARELAAPLLSGRALAPILAQERATARPGLWSSEGRAHLLKCTQALMLAGEARAAELLVTQGLSDQRPDGHFVTQPGDDHVMLHPHLYAVEGLWVWSETGGGEQARAHATHSTEWLWAQQLPSGGFPRWISRHATGPEQMDVTSQAVRAALLLGLRPGGLERAVSRLTDCTRPDPAHGRAVFYRPHDLAHHLNTWVTMFASQALALSGGERAVAWSTLV